MRPDGQASELRWYLVQTQPHREQYASSQLTAQNFHNYLPLVAKTIRHARRHLHSRAPLFPRYLFVRLDLGRDRWRSVNGTFGVQRLISVNGSPQPVPQGVVELLLERCGPDGLTRLEDRLAVGQNVQVGAGPFTNMLGTLARLDANGRVRVLLELMGGQIAVDLASSHVQPVD
jgi:transcription elongation factor/antiterminator RfaH